MFYWESKHHQWYMTKSCDGECHWFQMFKPDHHFWIKSAQMHQIWIKSSHSPKLTTLCTRDTLYCQSINWSSLSLFTIDSAAVADRHVFCLLLSTITRHTMRHIHRRRQFTTSCRTRCTVAYFHRRDTRLTQTQQQSIRQMSQFEV